MITLIDDTLLDKVSAEAAASPRRRKNHNFHPTNEFPAHRLLNAVQMDSYIPPHRHLANDKDETFVVLRGLLGVLEFDDSGKVVSWVKVGPDETVKGVDIPYGTWHTAVALAPDTIFLEAKSGPYEPSSPEEKATWAPAEGDAGATAYLESLRSRFAEGAGG